jgi:hypothetical protein
VREKILLKIRNTSALWLTIGISGGLLVASQIIMAIMWALYKAQLFDGYAANGIFQLLDPLRRLHAGQFFGRDFPFFHGPFTVLIHYPIFLLFGHDLYAAGLAEWLVSPLLTLLIIFIFMRILFKRRLPLQLVGTWLVYEFAVWLLPAIISPANSLLGVRLIGPILLTLSFWYWHKLESKSWHGLNLLWDVATPFLIAFALLTGTEFGLASLAAALVVYVIFQKGTIINRLLGSARLLVISLLFLVALASILSAGHPFAILRYSFVDIPADQFWYFGGPPNPFLVSFGQVFNDQTMQWNFLAFAATFYVLYRCIKARLISTEKLRAISFLLAASMLSIVPIFGYFYPQAQTEPLRLYLILDAMLLFSVIPYNKLGWSVKKLHKHIQPRLLQSIILVAVIVPTVSLLAWQIAEETIYHHEHSDAIVESHTVVSGTHLAPWWEKTYKAYSTGTAGLTQSKDIWSLYSGLLEADKGTFNPSGYDYIIHALGPQKRADYINTFSSDKPQSVITLQSPYFRYQPWLENQTWPFFEQLYNNYAPVTKSDMAIVWRRTDQPWKPVSNSWTSQASLAGPQQATTVVSLPGTSPANTYVLYTFNLSYDITNKLGPIPYIGKMPRYFVQNSGLSSVTSTALPPYDRDLSFPVLVRGNDTEVVFNFSTVSLVPGAHLKVTLLKWRQENIAQSTLKQLYSASTTLKVPKAAAKK